MYEQYIPTIAFMITAIVCVIAGGLFFSGGKGWVKIPLSSNLFVSKFQGFIAFLTGAVIVSIFAIYLEKTIRAQLYANESNLVWILIGFLIVWLIYYCHKYKFKLS